MSIFKVGIVGGAGYTSGELLRLLLYHPQVEIRFVQSSSNAGNFLHQVHTDLLGMTDLKFSTQHSDDIDVLFLCFGHGDSAMFLNENKIEDRVKIIDLSQDFRLKNIQSQFVYGLPEVNQSAIQKAQKIANPGCFATAIQLALLPLAHKQLLRSDVHVSAITGSTGAGQSLSRTSHFSWRNNNVSVYKAFTHQHLAEIQQTLHSMQTDLDSKIFFVPYRGNFTRGILASVYLKSDLALAEANDLYRQYYQPHPFVKISPDDIDLKQVVNTNNCFLYLEKHEDTLLIVSAIDNLLKGASGQAVQNMNLMLGIDESEGLKLKPGGF
jgi:N-acetyl-gamma-glutamyl-phosphate reductase